MNLPSLMKQGFKQHVYYSPFKDYELLLQGDTICTKWNLDPLRMLSYIQSFRAGLQCPHSFAFMAKDYNNYSGLFKTTTKEYSAHILPK